MWAEIIAKRIIRRPKKDDSEKKAKKKERKREKEREKEIQREKERNERGFIEDFYDDDEIPWTDTPMTMAEILRGIKDGPSVNELMKKKNKDLNDGLDLSKQDAGDPYVDKPSDNVNLPIPFNTFEDFMKSSYYEGFAAECKREVPLTKEELGPDMFPF